MVTATLALRAALTPLTAGKATWNGRETEWLAERSPRSAKRRQEARFPMLVITRREGEEVVIGNPAAPLGIVRIAAIKGDRVRIALEFPREVEVHRREVADQILKDDENPGIAGQIRPTGDSG
jgi:carbon storage regulator